MVLVSGAQEMPATGEVRNNIFYNGRICYFGLDSNQMSGSNNLLFYSDAHKKYSQEKFPNDIVNVDPLFIDIDNDDYLLHPNSPAIDAGISLDFDRDYVGNSRLVEMAGILGLSNIGKFSPGCLHSILQCV